MGTMATAKGKSHAMIVKELIRIKVDVNVKGKNERSALSIACKANELEIIQYLIKGKAHLDTVDERQMTPLHLSSTVDVVNCLILAQADVNITDQHGATALISSWQHGNPNIVELLIDKSSNIDQRDAD